MKVPLLFKTSINKSTLWSISHLISHLLPPFYSCACGFLKSTPPNYTLTDKQNSWYCILVHLHDVWLHRLKDFGYATYTEMLTVWNLSLKEKGSNAEVKKNKKQTETHKYHYRWWLFSLFFNICFSFTTLILHITTFMFSAAASDLKDQMQIRLAHRKEVCTMSPYFSEPCQA